MSLIDRFLPTPRLHQTDSIEVAAPPDVAWAHLRALDLYDAAVVRWLFDLRLMPARFLAWLSGDPTPRSSRHMHVEDIVAPRSGFSLLAEEPGRELVVGSVGKFWRPDIEWRYVAPDQFAAFAEPGWGKLAWNLRVEPRGAGSKLTCEVRVTATDDAAWKKFRRYWRLIGPFSHAIRRSVLHRLADHLVHVTRRAA